MSDKYEAITSIDLQTGHSPVDPAYAHITKHKKWDIPWMVRGGGGEDEGDSEGWWWW